MTKRLITFSLWGDSPKYTVGALKNARLAGEIFPEWICRFHVGSSTPSDVIDALSRCSNVEVVKFAEPGDWQSLAWRFLAAADESVEVMISSDTDSRLGRRERAAVDEWLASDKLFHVMRDHPYHRKWPILGGMWGVRGGLLKNIEALLEAGFRHRFDEYKWGSDQIFLGHTVHPQVRSHTLVHDELSPVLEWDAMSERRRFPTPRVDYEFVGQVFDEEDWELQEYVDVLIDHLEEGATK